MRTAIALLCLSGALLAPASASAEFGLEAFDVSFADSGGSASMQAGSHPFAMTTLLELNSLEEGGKDVVDGALKDLEVRFAPGLVADPAATPRCSTLDFLDKGGGILPQCADSTAVGIVRIGLEEPGALSEPAAVFNLEPPPGAFAKLGFWAVNVPVTVTLGLDTVPPYEGLAVLRNTSQVIEVFGSEFTVWGNPAEASHDPLRGECAVEGGACPADIPVRPFLTLPRSCEGPLQIAYRATSWWSGDRANPGPSQTVEGQFETHDDFGEPLGTSGCDSLGFAPTLSAQASTAAAESPSGLEVAVQVDDEGLGNPSGTAHSDIKRAVVTLPEGFTANPSVAEGLATCSPARLAAETLASEPGEGCPQASKIGAVEVESPLLEGELLRGALFLAAQDDPATPAPGAENPFDSLLALYVVIRHPPPGVLVKLAGRVEPDPRTGRLTATFGDPSSADPAYRTLPQLPFSDFRLRLREGARSPLISPNRCGTHTTVAKFTPWADPAKVLTTTSELEIASGVGGGPCPSGGVPPFEPGFLAGSQSNEAGAYSPFHMRLTRRDGDQDMTKFSATLPPGVVGKLAGVGICSDAQIALAKERTGRQELAAPSCPAGSRIGRTVAGAGVGSQLTYVPGSIHLAGPYNGAPLSVVAITPAVAGPFDAGTVVVREALRIDPLTAEVRVDGDASDPIPHILEGIPLKVRDLRVHVEREGFTLNPTSCDPSQATATLFGSFLDVFSAADDRPVALSSRYQAANCDGLGFRPRLSLALKGGTKRGGHPALTGTFRPRAGDANLKRLVLRLPRSAFLDQAHIRTICTRVQFAADACPKAAVYGTATAWTPLLAEPLSGPVYLRSSTNKLPDFVADLHGLVDVEAVARIDSKGGGIRATFPIVPDAPLSKVVVRMQGAKKGLIVNSRDLCAAPSRADVRMSAHNAKRSNARPLVRARCGKAKRNSHGGR